MPSLKYLVFLAATTLAAQVRLGYLDLGPQPTPCCMVTDAEGNAYVAGSYVTSTAPSFFTPSKIVVFKLNPTNGTIYRLIFGGSGADTPTSIAADAEGNLFVTGFTTSPDFPLVNPLIRNAPLVQQPQGFLSKIDKTGTLVFSTFIGGLQSSIAASAITTVSAMTLDANGDVYITGTGASNFPVTAGAYAASGTAFVMKLSNSGDKILFSTFIGSGGFGNAIVVDDQGTITVAGSASGNGFSATPGAFQTSCRCGTRIAGGIIDSFPVGYLSSFVLRLSADGGRLIWSTYLGGSGAPGLPGGVSQDLVSALALTSDGCVLAVGTAQSPDFPVTAGAFQTAFQAQSNPYGTNLFITKFNSTGTALEYSTFLGGSVAEQLGGLQLDAQENVWITGTTQSPDFPLLPHSLNLGNEFLVELASDGSSLLSSRTLPNGAAGTALALGPSGSETVLGSAGSFMRVPARGFSQTSLLAQFNAEASNPSGRVAPGEVVNLFGTGLGPFRGVSVQPDSSGKYPTEVAGVQVTCDGIPAPLLYVSTHQINAVIPFEVSSKPSTLLRVTYGSKTTPPLNLTVVPAYPEIFSVPLGFQPAYLLRNAVARNQDGSVNSPSNPAEPGSKVTFWVNGAGLFQPSLADGMIVQPPLPQPLLPVSVLYVGIMPGQTIPATISAAPGQVAGTLEISATLPQIIFPPYAELLVTVGGFASDPVNIAVQAGQ